MPNQKLDPDADTAAAHAARAEQLVKGPPGADAAAAAHASLAVYYQLKANKSGNSDLAAALKTHAGAMEDFGPMRRR